MKERLVLGGLKIRLGIVKGDVEGHRKKVLNAIIYREPVIVFINVNTCLYI